MPNIVELEQQSQAWHEFRQGKIGASDVPIIMGISEYCTPFQLWEEKVGLSQRPRKDYLQKFVEAEGPIREKISESFGFKFSPAVIQSTENKRLIASLDGANFEERFGLEIKHTDAEDHAVFVRGEIPAKHYPQIQHQFYVSDFKSILYVDCHQGEIRCMPVVRDDEYIKKMLEKEILFLQNIDDFIAPDLCARDYNTNDSEEWKASAAEWQALNREIKLLTSRQDQAKKSLINICQGRNTVGYGLKIQRIIRKGSVDYGLVPELNGVNLEQYRKAPIESWRIG